MQQGHPRRKQLDRAEYEMKMYKRRRAREFSKALCTTFNAVSETIMSVARGMSRAFGDMRIIGTYTAEDKTYSRVQTNGRLTSIEM